LPSCPSVFRHRCPFRFVYYNNVTISFKLKTIIFKKKTTTTCLPAMVRSCITNVLPIIIILLSRTTKPVALVVSRVVWCMRTRRYVHGRKACRIHCFDNSTIRISIERLKPRFSVKTRNVDGDYDIIVISIVVIMTSASASRYERQTNPNAVTVPIL